MGLDSVELIMEAEETFGFTIPNEDAVTLVTVGKLFDYIMAHRFGGRQPGCLLIVRQLGVRSDDVTKEARFVEDLGVD